MSQEEAQIQEKEIQTQNEVQESQMEAQVDEILASRADDQMGKAMKEREIWVGSRISKKPTWMADYV